MVQARARVPAQERDAARKTKDAAKPSAVRTA
jgi:hypothetical protein